MSLLFQSPTEPNSCDEANPNSLRARVAAQRAEAEREGYRHMQEMNRARIRESKLTRLANLMEHHESVGLIIDLLIELELI